MPSRTHEASFAAFATAQRPRLQGVAYLIHGDVHTAERVVDASLAQLFDIWPLIGNAEDALFRRLLDAKTEMPERPQHWAPRIELIDRVPGLPRPGGIVGALAALQPDERQALVLERFAELPIWRIAGILDLPARDVQGLTQSARQQLILAEGARRDDEVLAAELADAIPYDLRTAFPAALDIAHGKQLARRRLGRRLAITTAAVAVLASLAVWAPRTLPEGEGSTPAPAASAARPAWSPPCRSTDESCRTRVLAAWRTEMADVVRSYLDPGRTYFAGYGHEPEAIYESPTFWQGRGGVLGLHLSPSRYGATVIYLQVATTRDRAIPCGLLTNQQCVSQRFLDGNRFALTETTFASEGIEVQYSPDGTEVVTIVARSATVGRALDVSRGDLIKLIQDPRLRLPHG